MPNMNDALFYADNNADRGEYMYSINIFPLLNRDENTGRIIGEHGKIACVKDWPNAATKDPQQIAKWWNGHDYNIGIVTGRKNRLFVIDIDNHNGVDGSLALRAAEKDLGALPDTWTVLTGGGGTHYYFRYPINHKLSNKSNFKGDKYGPGIDCRGEGGYVVAPPSIHPETGKKYEWDVALNPREIDIADLPPAWIAAIENPTETAPAAHADNNPLQAAQRDFFTLPDEIPQGSRNETIYSYGIQLAKNGDSLGEIDNALRLVNAEKCKPPLQRAELEKTIASLKKHVKEYRQAEKEKLKEQQKEQAANNKPPRFMLADCESFLQAQGITIKYNVMSKESDIEGMPPEYSRMNAENSLPTYLFDRACNAGFKVASDSMVAKWLDLIADKNRYNPIIDKIESIKWDGIDRLPILHDILRLKPEQTHEKELLKKWLIQSVAMAFNSRRHDEGKQPLAAEGVLTLQGPQRAGKTFFFQKISGGFCADGLSIDMNRPDDIKRAISAWIGELGELDSTTRRDQSDLKGFITSPFTEYRTPYARKAIKYPRLTSFCATVNPPDFLHDTTGNRRYWVIRIEKSLDLERLKALTNDEVWQIWRQVYEQYFCANPESYRLDDELTAWIEETNSGHRAPVACESELRDCYNWAAAAELWNWITLTDIKKQLEIYAELPKNTTNAQMGRALNTLGVEKKTVHGNRTLYKMPPLLIGSPQDDQQPPERFLTVDEENITWAT